MYFLGPIADSLAIRGLGNLRFCMTHPLKVGRRSKMRAEVHRAGRFVPSSADASLARDDSKFAGASLATCAGLVLQLQLES